MLVKVLIENTPAVQEQLRMSGLKKSWVTAWKHFAQAKRLSFEEIY